MAERTLLSRLYKDPTTQPFEVWQEADGSVTIKAGNANVVTATPSGTGLEIETGSDTRSFVTAEMSGGVPTGNFS